MFTLARWLPTTVHCNAIHAADPARWPSTAKSISLTLPHSGHPLQCPTHIHLNTLAVHRDTMQAYNTTRWPLITVMPHNPPPLSNKWAVPLWVGHAQIPGQDLDSQKTVLPIVHPAHSFGEGCLLAYTSARRPHIAMPYINTPRHPGRLLRRRTPLHSGTLAAYCSAILVFTLAHWLPTTTPYTRILRHAGRPLRRPTRCRSDTLAVHCGAILAYTTTLWPPISAPYTTARWPSIVTPCRHTI